MNNETITVETLAAEAPPAEKKVSHRTKAAKTTKATVRKPRAKKTQSKKGEVANAAKNAAENEIMTAAEQSVMPTQAAEIEKEVIKEDAVIENNATEDVIAETLVAEVDVPAVEEKAESKEEQSKPQKIEVKTEQKHFSASLPNITINNIIELAQAPQRSIILTDQQIQQLSLEDIEERHVFLEQTLARVLDYDLVISDTNIWLELLVGHTSSHSDPRVNARLQFERQLEFISKFMQYRGGRFIMMGETYEEIDRFASLQDPTNHKEADFTDNLVSLNAAARLAKRLILTQQRENRLRIEGISAESHHAAFADPAIIRRVVELFAAGKKVLLLTNDASVAIRSMGLCDDLQHHNNITDEVWDNEYAPLRPMVMTFDDLKLLDFYTRQYYYITMASAMKWMGAVDRKVVRNRPEPLALRLEAFRPGDRRKGDNLNPETITEKNTGNSVLQKQKQQKQRQQQKQKQQQQQQKQEQKVQQQESEQQDVVKAEQDSIAGTKATVSSEASSAANVVTTVQDANNNPSIETSKEDPQSKNKTDQKPKQKQRKKPQRSPKKKTEEVKTE